MSKGPRNDDPAAGLLGEVDGNAPAWGDRWLLWLTPLAVIAALVCLAYASTLRAEFVFDDLELIVTNEAFLHGEAVGEYSARYRFRQELMRSFKRDLELSGGQPDPAIFHAANVLTHLAVVTLVYGLLLLLARRFRWPFGERVTFASIGAGLFALHPLASEAVAYVTGRADLLATFYSLIALGLFFIPLAWRPAGEAEGEDAPEAPPLPPGRYWAIAGLAWIGCALAFGKAILSKEVAAALPLLILLVAVLTPGWRPLMRRRFMVPWIVLSLIVVAVIVLRVVAFGTLGNPDVERALGSTLTTNFWALLRYFTLWLVPVGQSIDHEFPILPGPFTGWGLVGLLIVAIFISAAWFFRRRAPEVSLGIAWFLIAFLPTNSVVPIEDVIVERRAYLPSIGPAIVVAGVAIRLRRRLATKASPINWARAGRWVIGSGAALLLLLTANRAWVIGDELRVWADAMSKVSTKARPFYNLGTALIREGYPEHAIGLIAQVFKTDIYDIDAHMNVGTAFMEAGELDRAKWIFKNNVLSIDPDNAKARYNLAVVHERLGELDKAKGYLEEAIALEPDMSQALSKLGVIEFASDEPRRAVEYFERALAVDNSDTLAHRYLALIYGEVLGEPAKVREHLEALTTLEPKEAQHWFNLGVWYDRQGTVEEAREHYLKALSLAPDHVGAMVNLAALHERTGVRGPACRLMNRAAGLDPGFAAEARRVCSGGVRP